MTTLIQRIHMVLATGLLIVPFPQVRSATHAVGTQGSKLEILVGKSGLFSAFGHNHVIDAAAMTGNVDYDAADVSRDAVTFTVSVASLKVMDPGESDADRQKVQATMIGATVLDAEKFPDITFISSSVAPARSSVAGWTGLDLSGVLQLHGVKRPMHVPVQLHDDDGVLHIRGDVTLKQTDFGMTPVTAAGGAVKVKDEVKITFEIVAPRLSGRGHAFE